MVKSIKAPWQILAVIGSDFIVNVISVWGWIVVKSDLEWNFAILAILISWAIYGIVWWGLFKGKKWGLVAKGVLIVLQALEYPWGTMIAAFQVLLFLSGSSRKYFGFLGRKVK